jgi:hypothetical protein
MKKVVPLLFILIGWIAVYAYRHRPQSPTVQQICSPGYASSVRDVPIEVKKQAYDRDGVQYEPGKYVVDHIVSLELGGTNDLSNLQVQTVEDGRSKDQVENLLHDRLCSGQITLQEAQREIRDWRNVH